MQLLEYYENRFLYLVAVGDNDRRRQSSLGHLEALLAWIAQLNVVARGGRQEDQLFYYPFTVQRGNVDGLSVLYVLLGSVLFDAAADIALYLRNLICISDKIRLRLLTR